MHLLEAVNVNTAAPPSGTPAGSAALRFCIGIAPSNEAAAPLTLPHPPPHPELWCRALRSRPAADYEPWAAALPYIYKLERLLPCSTGEGVLSLRLHGLGLRDCESGWRGKQALL